MYKIGGVKKIKNTICVDFTKRFLHAGWVAQDVSFLIICGKVECEVFYCQWYFALMAVGCFSWLNRWEWIKRVWPIFVLVVIMSAIRIVLVRDRYFRTVYLIFFNLLSVIRSRCNCHCFVVIRSLYNIIFIYVRYLIFMYKCIYNILLFALNLKMLCTTFKSNCL